MPAGTRPLPDNKVDYAAGTLLTIAAVLCAGPLFRDGAFRGEPRAFPWISGIVALIFFGALIGMWVEPLRRRHGYVRLVALAGAVILAVSALFLTGAPAFLLLISYWVPAVLAMLAALRLSRAHRQAGEEPLSVTVRRRASRRR